MMNVNMIEIDLKSAPVVIFSILIRFFK